MKCLYMNPSLIHEAKKWRRHDCSGDRRFAGSVWVCVSVCECVWLKEVVLGWEWRWWFWGWFKRLSAAPHLGIVSVTVETFPFCYEPQYIILGRNDDGYRVFFLFPSWWPMSHLASVWMMRSSSVCQRLASAGLEKRCPVNHTFTSQSDFLRSRGSDQMESVHSVEDG